MLCDIWTFGIRLDQSEQTIKPHRQAYYGEILGERNAHIWRRVTGFIFLETFRRFEVKFY